MRSTTNPRDVVPWLFAAALHLAIPVVAAVAPMASRPRMAVASEAWRVSEIEVEPEAPLVARAVEAPPTDGSGAGTEAPGPEADPRRRARQRSPLATSDDAPPPEGVPSSDAATPSGPPADGYDAPPDDGRGAVVVPGLGGTPVWAVPGAIAQPDLPRPAPTTPTTPRTADRDVAGRVLRDVQTARDKAVGIDLPAAGTVASVVAEAVRSTDTPQVGRASYEVRLGPKGQVLGVRLLRATGGAADGWERAARLAAQRLAQRKLVMAGAFASGAIVIVDVSSVVQLPAGPGGGSAVKPGPPPGSMGGGASFDLSNIGAHPSRVVSTSFTTRPLR